jgi:UDP-N-acetylglucosamine:LPS N-acetylglucosamine transferase
MKKIIIFTSDGAGGHTATTNALSATLKDSYSIKPVNIFRDVLGGVDFIKAVSFGTTNGELFYERCLTRKYYTFLNTLHAVGKWYFRQVQKRMSKTLQKFLIAEKPDMVISVVPLVDGAVVDATQKLNIPFILLPTDLDSTNYIHDIKAPAHDGFLCTLPFEDLDIKQKLEPARIPDAKVITTGFPIRVDFFEDKDLKAIKTFYGVDQEKPVVLLLMGSVGSDSLYTFAKELTKVATPMHLVIICGRYQAMKEKVLTVEFPKHITVTAVDFVQKISDLMAISDLLVTKAGPVSMSEAMYMNLPMLVDITSTLDWEKLNYQFIQKRHFGDVITNINNVSNQVNNLLKNRDALSAMKNNLVSFDKKVGTAEVRRLIEKMI